MINQNRFAISCSACAALLWLVCSGLVAFAPEFMMLMTGHMFHADLGDMQWTLTWAGFLSGLLAWTVVSGLTGLVLIALYNYLLSVQSH
jgi:hypothetical protein